MARYIDAEKAVARFEACLWGKDYDGVLAKSCIDDAPTADVVEVVRCKECVHHKNAPKTTDVWCERLDGLLPKDWFCADGERRTDDDRNG